MPRNSAPEPEKRLLFRGHSYFASKGQRYFAARGQRNSPSGVKRTRLFHLWFIIDIEDVVTYDGTAEGIITHVTYKQKILDFLAENRNLPVLDKS
jgi:hypothetical protein